MAWMDLTEVADGLKTYLGTDLKRQGCSNCKVTCCFGGVMPN